MGSNSAINATSRSITTDIKVFVYDEYDNIISLDNNNNNNNNNKQSPNCRSNHDNTNGTNNNTSIPTNILCFINQETAYNSQISPNGHNNRNTIPSKTTNNNELPRLVGSEVPASEDHCVAIQKASHSYNYNNQYFLQSIPYYSKNNNNGYIFKNLELEPNLGANDGQTYSLVFMLYSNTNTTYNPTHSTTHKDLLLLSTLEPISVPFQFCTDHEIVSKIQDIKSRIMELQPGVLTIQNEIKTLKNDIITLERQSKQKLKNTHLPLSNQTQTPTSQFDNLLIYKSSLEKQLKDMQKTISSQGLIRPAIRPDKERNDPTMQHFNTLGKVVDIAYVDNELDAKICSYHAREFMDAYIVDTLEQSSYLYKQKYKAWALEGMSTINGRLRNQTEMETQKLPGMKSLENIAGNPVYLIELIQLPKQYEYLRDTLFFNIFGMTILVDTLDDAVAYRKLLISEKKSRFPKIITRQGDILPSNG